MRRMFSENQIKGLIEADKDVISQIITTDSNVFFPIGVLPIKAFDNTSGSYVFFDYKNERVKDSDGEELYRIYYELINGKINITIDQDTPEFTELYYISFSGNLDVRRAGNWYKILNPTVLYLHEIIDNTENNAIRVVTTQPTQFSIDDVLVFKVNDNVLSIEFYYEQDGYSMMFSELFFEDNEGKLGCQGTFNNESKTYDTYIDFSNITEYTITRL